MMREMKLTVKEGLDKWQLNQTRSKQQSDASSCGVFVLMVKKYFIVILLYSFTNGLEGIRRCVFSSRQKRRIG